MGFALARPRWRFSRLALHSPHHDRIRERLEFVRGFFPELEGVTVRVGLARKRGVLGWGSLHPEHPGVWVRPRRLDAFTIAHELTHLLQARGLVPRGERACDLWALARSPLLVDTPPGYLRVPAELRRERVLSARDGALLHRAARRALDARARGERGYLRHFECDLSMAMQGRPPEPAGGANRRPHRRADPGPRFRPSSPSSRRLNPPGPGAMLDASGADRDEPAASPLDPLEDPMSDEFGHPAQAHHPPVPVAGRRVRVAAAVVWRDGRLLLTQRPPAGPLGLQWELPGGKIEDGESPEHALAREIREELGVHATPLEVLEVDTHDYPHGLEVEVVFVRCMLDSHDFTPSPAVQAVRWMTPESIELGTVLAGDREFLKGLGAKSR